MGFCWFMMVLSQIVLVLLISWVALDIRKSQQEFDRYMELVTADKDEIPNYSDFKIKNVFPFSAPVDRRLHIFNNFSMLKLGLSKFEVQAILGHPDYSTPMSAKKKYTYMGSKWTYCFEKPNPNLVNHKHDKCLQLFFTSIGKLNWVASNIEQLPDIGSPNYLS